MPSLSSKLKSLGVQVGARGSPPVPPARRRRLHVYDVETVVPGLEVENEDGTTFVVESSFALDYRHGDAPIHSALPLAGVARWANDARIAGSPREQLVFLDIETTGLAGGAGTIAFMIGVGRFEADHFRVGQFFLRDPVEEAALLRGLDEWLASCQVLVTFNGRAFDLPLLSNRYTINRRTPSFVRTAHLDLLPLARRLWRDRLESRALGSLEQHILRARRAQGDVPGWLIPSIYFDYLRNRDARPLRGVFYHNTMDILAMAALLSVMARILHDPLGELLQHPLDYVSLGRLYEGLEEPDIAARVYERGIAYELPASAFREASRRLAYIYRRNGRYEQSVEIWNVAAERGELYAHICLAKYYEHHARNYKMAEQMTREAIRIMTTDGASAGERGRTLPELHHRLERLRRKQRRTSGDA